MRDDGFDDGEHSPRPVANSMYATRTVYITFPTAYQPSSDEYQNGYHQLDVTADALPRPHPDTSPRELLGIEEPFNRAQSTFIQASELEAEPALMEGHGDRQIVGDKSDGFEHPFRVQAVNDSDVITHVTLHEVGTGERYVKSVKGFE